MKESTLNLASFERTTDILFDAAARNQVRTKNPPGGPLYRCTLGLDDGGIFGSRLSVGVLK
jgi:hypothetical protein